MKKYLLIGHDQTKAKSLELGTINAHSLDEAALFLAHHFPNYYFRSNIVKVKESEDDSPEFLCIPDSDYYAATNNGVVPSPVEDATKMFLNRMMYNNNFYDEFEDYYGDITYTMWDSVSSRDGKIVKNYITEEDN